MKLFINDKLKQEHFCLLVDKQRYYTFNGKYALYDLQAIQEKKEYAYRIGNLVEVKQVAGTFTGLCPHCKASVENAPVVKGNSANVCYCHNCQREIMPMSYRPFSDILSTMENGEILYEDIDLSEEMEEAVEYLEDIEGIDDVEDE